MAGKQLYTEADVRALPHGAELVLGPDAIATPSALDLAFERGLRVVRSVAGTSGPRAGDCPECLRGLLAQDGTYIVQVRAGRAVVTRLTEAGPQAYATLPRGAAP